jgi:hypothetical protein
MGFHDQGRVVRDLWCDGPIGSAVALVEETQRVLGELDLMWLVGRAVIEHPEDDIESLKGLKVPTVHLAHPGILMRGDSERNPWPAGTRAHVDALKTVLSDLGLTGE